MEPSSSGLREKVEDVERVGTLPVCYGRPDMFKKSQWIALTYLTIYDMMCTVTTTSYR